MGPHALPLRHCLKTLIKKASLYNSTLTGETKDPESINRMQKGRLETSKGMSVSSGTVLLRTEERHERTVLGKTDV